MDKSLFTACRYTGKVRTEENASDFRVCSKCGGITHKTVGAPRKTTYDLTVDNKVATTTEIIPETDLLKQEAFRCSYCAETLYDYSELDGLVKTAQRLYDNTEEGDRAGNVPEGAKETFKAVIDEAVALIESIDSATTELVVDEEPVTVEELVEGAIADLRSAFEAFTELIIPFPDKTALSDLINTAQDLYDGSEDTDYQEGARAELLVAIGEATTVLEDDTAITSEVEGAVTALETAISTFNAAKINP